jgi:Holliday junction resolvase
MPINSRNKGAQGEREVAKIIFDELGIECQRNLDQWRSGGFDLTGLDGWAIEVKRAKKPLLAQWWTQTVEQAEQAQLHPVLWYRLDNQKWRVVVPLNRICAGLEYSAGLEYTAELTPEGFACLYREKYLSD